jgi:outer membrane protein assembly factor BamB
MPGTGSFPAYVCATSDVVVVSGGNRLVALDPQGKTLWERALGTVIGPVAIAEDVLLVSTDIGVSCVQLRDGADSAQQFCLFPQSLDERVSLSIRTVGPRQHRLAVEIRKTGVVWTAPFSHQRATVGSGYVVAALFSGELICLRDQDGAELWRATLPQDIGGTAALAISKGQVVVASRGSVRVLDLPTGRVSRHIVLPEIAAPLAQISESSVFLFGHGELLEVNWVNGRVKIDRFRSEALSAGSTVDAGHFLVLGKAVVWTHAGGTELFGWPRGRAKSAVWKAELKNAFLATWAPMAVCGRLLYVPDFGAGGVRVFEC